VLQVPSGLADSGVILAPAYDFSASDISPSGEISSGAARRGAINSIIEFVTSNTVSNLYAPEFESGGDFHPVQSPLLQLNSELARIDYTQDGLVRDVGNLYHQAAVARARSAEEVDGRINESNESRIVIHGMTAIIPEGEYAARQKLIIAAVTDALTRIFGKHQHRVLSGQVFGGIYPVFEATMDSVLSARDLRLSFSRLPLARRRSLKIRILNSTTPGTRVRIAIFKVISLFVLWDFCLSF